MSGKCEICKKVVDDFVPEYCCDGTDCGCMGLPIEPCFCSKECEDKFDERIEESIKQSELERDI